ncbi:hypothetical protein H632_c1346p0, partial [Helicosporidium sp. ATCC 50920]
MAAHSSGTPASSVFVGNLSYDVTEQEVTAFFGQVGPVKGVRMVADRETGKPRGFGFVEYFDVATAESAIRNLSGRELGGRTLRIVFNETNAPPPPRGGGGGFGGGPSPGSFDDRGGPGAGVRGGSQAMANRSRVVGGDLAFHSALGVSSLLGQDPSAPPRADALTQLLARKTRSELYVVLAQMQSLLLQNPQQARGILLQNPVLARCLLQIQVILGYVGNPLGDVAPKGCAPSNTMPGSGRWNEGGGG